MADTASLLKNLATIAVSAVRTLVVTLVLMLLLGGVLMVPSFLIASKAGTWWGALAALLSLVVAGALGWMMATQKATAAALQVAVEQYQIGPQTVQALFALLPTLPGAQAAAALLPLAQAEELLHRATQALLRAPHDGGGLQGLLRRKVQGYVCEKIAVVTLAQGRGAEGGVDMQKVRDLVATAIDTALREKIDSLRSTANLWVYVTVVAAVAMAWAIRYATVRYI